MVKTLPSNARAKTDRLLFGLLQRNSLDESAQQTALGVHRSNHIIHGLEHRLWLMNDQFGPFGHEIELTIGDQRCDLDNDAFPGQGRSSQGRSIRTIHHGN